MVRDVLELREQYAPSIIIIMEWSVHLSEVVC